MGVTATLGPGTTGLNAARGLRARRSWVPASNPASVEIASKTPISSVDLSHMDRRVGGATSVSTPQHELTVLATVAHELRGPLTALATSSELLVDDFEHLDPAQVKGMLSAIHRRTLWLQGLVENLLCAATIREGRLQLTANR